MKILSNAMADDEKKGTEAYETQAYEALEKDFQAVRQHNAIPM